MILLRHALAAFLGLSLLAVSVLGRADAPVLHEFIPPDATEDLKLGARTPDGRMPAAERTTSGVISAPGFLDTNQPRQVAYGGGATPDSIDSTFRLDRDTTEPSVVRYDDPFTPSVAPFKRLYAFDAVDAELELKVFDKRLSTLPLATEPGTGYDRFFGDLFVDLAPGVPVRIPSVGPGSRLLAIRVEPEAKLELRQDSAENWFVIGDARRRVRLILDVSAPRAGFGSEYGDPSYGELAAWVRPLPPNAQTVVSEVLNKLGLSRTLRPRDALETLVAHFRSFNPSSDLPTAQAGTALYRELVLDRKGVCRHRAFGFMLTALGLGIPTRFVRNEAHAWIEVRDRVLWHRIDLGGAAQRFELDTHPGAPAHAVPPDPYPWPSQADSGLARTRASGATSGAAPGTSPGSQPRATGSAAPSASVLPIPSSGRAESAPAEFSSLDRARSVVDLEIPTPNARRGSPIRVVGKVKTSSVPCGNARVDILLIEPAGSALIGSVPTDADGHFDSQVTIPFDIGVGEYTLRATTPGTARCGPSD